MNKTSIEWCNRPETRGPAGAMTWNPIRARLKGASTTARTGTFCTRISPGCLNCYASVINKRFGTGLEYTVPNLDQHEFVLDQRFLEQPMKQKKPCTIFVGDMFDLFHEAIPYELIASVLRVAHETPQHTKQFLTKRAERMSRIVNRAQAHWGVEFGSHMWFGVSVEDQKRADERIPHLLETDCAVRFLSVEPMLEEVDLQRPAFPDEVDGPRGDCLRGLPVTGKAWSKIDWVICGGESGPHARPFNLAWAESLLAQCRAANTAFFLKQIGGNPVPNSWRYSQGVRDRKGGDPAEWPEALRVREFPAVHEAVTT